VLQITEEWIISIKINKNKKPTRGQVSRRRVSSVYLSLSSIDNHPGNSYYMIRLDVWGSKRTKVHRNSSHSSLIIPSSSYSILVDDVDLFSYSPSSPTQILKPSPHLTFTNKFPFSPWRNSKRKKLSVILLRCIYLACGLSALRIVYCWFFVPGKLKSSS